MVAGSETAKSGSESADPLYSSIIIDSNRSGTIHLRYGAQRARSINHIIHMEVVGNLNIFYSLHSLNVSIKQEPAQIL